MSEYILEANNITKRFPGVLALDKVSFNLKKGEILGICGENGAGKSTLMKVLSGSYPHQTYDGEIIVDGKKMKFDSVAMAQGVGIEMIYQELNMILDSSIAENLYVGNLPTKKGFVQFDELYANTSKMLEMVQLDLAPRTHVRMLNSGQMQLISMMRAYSKKPRILVFDEPTTALTDKEVKILFKVLKQLKAEGVSCIYISHKLEELFENCDRVVVMRDGKTVSNYKIDEVDKDTLVTDMVGRKLSNFYPKISHDIGDEIFRVEDLTIPHPYIMNKNILENVSFNLKKGEILGIGGLVGAGRSEALGAIFGQFTKGVKKKVFVEGKETIINGPKDATDAGIGFVTEERKTNGIVWMLSIRENIALVSLKELSKRVFMDRDKEKKEVAKIIERLRIKTSTPELQVTQLSGGNQQKVVLGKWLLKNPKILFVDEPTKGVDVGAKAEVYQIMSELTEKGVSIIMVSSDMPELISMSDRCIVFSNGRITGEFSREQISEKNVMEAAIMQ